MYVVSVTASTWYLSDIVTWCTGKLKVSQMFYESGSFLKYVWWLSKFSIYVVAFEYVCVCVCVHARVCMHGSHFSHVWLFVTPRAVAEQASPFMGFSRQEYWIGLPFPPRGYFPNPGIEPLSPVSPALQADSLPTEPPEKLLSILVLKCMVSKRWKREKWREKETDARDFPGGPLVKTLCLHCRGHSFHLWSGN